MQDALKANLGITGITVHLPHSAQCTAFAGGEPVVVPSAVAGFGTSLTLQHRDGALTIKGNPIGWLTGQNVWGTSDMPALNLQVFAALRARGVLQFTTAQWQSLQRGHYQINELAFAQYIQVATDHTHKLQTMAWIKLLYAAAITHWPGNTSTHMYPGHGIIVRNRHRTLCIYDKLTELMETERVLDPALVGSLTPLEGRLRMECTLKYGWLRGARRLQVRDWNVADWNAEARRLVIDTAEAFKLPYLLACPNVFARDYGKNFTPRETTRFLNWRAGTIPDARTVRHFRLAHGLDMELGAEAHRAVLFQHMWPSADVAGLWSMDSARVAEAMLLLRRGLEDRAAASSWAARMLPLASRICGSGPPARVRAVERRAGLRNNTVVTLLGPQASLRQIARR